MKLNQREKSKDMIPNDSVVELLNQDIMLKFKSVVDEKLVRQRSRHYNSTYIDEEEENSLD